MTHVHLIDVRAARAHVTCRVGEGVVPIERCLTALREIGCRGALSIELEPAPGPVPGEILLDGSFYDGYRDGPGASDAAAILEEQTIGGQAAGLTGVVIDFAGLPRASFAYDTGPFTSWPFWPAVITMDDLELRVWEEGTGWVAAPQPTAIAILANAGADGRDRLTITFQPGAIRETWLEVTVLATETTGLSEPHTVVLGNLPGDASGDGVVDGTDLAILLDQFGQQATATAGPMAADLTADGRVSLRDASTLLHNWGRELDEPDTGGSSEPLAVGTGEAMEHDGDGGAIQSLAEGTGSDVDSEPQFDLLAAWWWQEGREQGRSWAWSWLEGQDEEDEDDIVDLLALAEAGA